MPEHVVLTVGLWGIHCKRTLVYARKYPTQILNTWGGRTIPEVKQVGLKNPIYITQHTVVISTHYLEKILGFIVCIHGAETKML
jgi:hypothetical protein